MNECEITYELQYTNPRNETNDWIPWDDYATIEEAKREIKIQNEIDKNRGVLYQYRIVEKKTIVVRYYGVENE